LDLIEVVPMALPALDFGRPLALSALVLLPLLWWLARPPRPRRRVATAHLPQWIAALRATRRRPLAFATWRFVLLALAFVAIVLAAADARIGAREGPLRLVVLVDTTASMAVREPDGVRAIDRARVEAERLVAELPDFVDVSLAFVGERIVVVPRLARATGRERRQESAPGVPADEVFVADRFAARSTGGGRVGGVAAGLAGAGLAAEDARVVAYGDLGTRGRGLVDDGRTVFVPLGSARADLANAGITSAVVRDGWPLASIEVDVEVVATSAWTRSGERLALALLEPEVVPGDESEPAVAQRPAIPLEFDADGVARVVVALERRRGGPVALGLVADDEPAETRVVSDALDLDDRIGLWIPPPPAPDVVLLADGEPGVFLEAAGELLARLGGGRVVPATGVEQAGFVLAEGGRLAVAPPRAITFATRIGGAEGELEPPAGRLAPVVVDWARDDPLLAGLDLSELRVERALSVAALPRPEGTVRVLLEGENGPLAVAAPGRGLHFAFRLADSNLPLLPAFPQLLRRGFALAYGSAAQARIVGRPLLDRDETLLGGDASAQPAPTMPGTIPGADAFGAPGWSLAVPALLVAALALAVRSRLL
jgi:hypothetical protein